MTQPKPRIRRAGQAAAAANQPRKRLRLPRWAASVPALGMIVVMLLLGVAGWAQRPDRIEARYRQDAETSLNSGDFRTSRVCYERLLQTSPTDKALLLGLGRSLLGLGQTTEAMELLERLAPADAAGYAPAHVLLAEQILHASTDPKALQLAETHLKRAIEADPRDPAAHDLLARLYANTGRSLQPIP